MNARVGQSVRPRELDGFEYQRMYDTGQMPERWFDYEADRAVTKYLNGEIELAELEYRLDPEAFVLEFELTSGGGRSGG